MVSAHFNMPGLDMFDYNVYAVCGDGCMMEGISSEAASLAAHLGLDTLCWVYDNNYITIEGNTHITFTEDVATRFLGYGWNVGTSGHAIAMKTFGASAPIKELQRKFGFESDRVVAVAKELI